MPETMLKYYLFSRKNMLLLQQFARLFYFIVQFRCGFFQQSIRFTLFQLFVFNSQQAHQTKNMCERTSNLMGVDKGVLAKHISALIIL